MGVSASQTPLRTSVSEGRGPIQPGSRGGARLCVCARACPRVCWGRVLVFQRVRHARERGLTSAAGQGAPPEVARGGRCGGAQEVAWTSGVVWHLAALRWLGLRVASFSPPPTLPSFPSFPCLPGPPLLPSRGRRTAGFARPFLGDPPRSRIQLGAGRVHRGGLRGKRAVTAWVTLVAEAGI